MAHHETATTEWGPGAAVPAPLLNPSANRGTAFTDEQRRRLGRIGRLPSRVLTLDEQAARAYKQLMEEPDDLHKNIFLEQLHDRNEVLYYKILADHLELMPVVYDPVVGIAIEHWSDEFRRPRGVYLSIDHAEDMEASFASLGLGPDDVDVVACSDAEEILGIGDWGVNGSQITVGKLAIYTVGGGINPARTISVHLDVGTDNELLLNDPYYLGNRHVRHRGADYDAFLQQYVETASRLYPKAVLHFEDFGPEHSRKIITDYGQQYRMFNDDAQGTGAVVVAAAINGIKLSKVPWREQVFIAFGAGTAGVGIADQVREAIVADGVAPEQAADRIWLVDQQGLLFDDMPDLRDYQKPYAKKRSQVPWAAHNGPTTLLDTIRGSKATFLLGASTASGAFTEDVVRAMCANTNMPMIFPISNPQEKVEAMPADMLRWSDGKAIIAMCFPVEPVVYNGTTYTIGQANNFLVYPGLVVGALVCRAKLITASMLQAAANAAASMVSQMSVGSSVLPDVSNIKAAAAIVAHQVVLAAVAEGNATVTPDNPIEAIHAFMWSPSYDE